MTRYIATALSIAIITLLFALGPVGAFFLELTVSDTSPMSGEVIIFMVSAEVEAGEFIPIDRFILRLNGKEDIECVFLPNGTIVSDCEGISIKNVSSSSKEFDGYGYGFTEGLLKFNITLDTSFYSTGKYKTKIIAIHDGEETEFKGDDIFINSEIKNMCSVRAEDGLLEVDDKVFEKVKLNYHIPLKKAHDGKGFLTGGKGKNRFTYKFEVKNILENNAQNLTALTKGTYKINRKAEKKTEAIIKLDKKSKKVEITDTNISAENLMVTFMRGC